MKICTIIFISLFFFRAAEAQKQKQKKDKQTDGRSKTLEMDGDSLRTDSIVVYETEIGFLMPDHNEKFRGKWDIQIMRRQAKAIPDTLPGGYIEFYDDTSFVAYVGCNILSGKYIIKGPTIKFTVYDSVGQTCTNDIEQWFLKLIRERVSYFGIDEKKLLLKDVAYNIVFSCSRKDEENKTSSVQK